MGKYTGFILKDGVLHLYENASHMREDMIFWGKTWDQSVWIEGVQFHAACEQRANDRTKWCCLFGEGTMPIGTLVGSYNNPHDLSFEQCYDRYRTWRLSDRSQIKSDIGGIYDKEFVFPEDCQTYDITVKLPSGEEVTYPDEWNLLSHWPGTSQPRHPVAQAVWDRRKLSFWDARDRIQRRTDAILRKQSVSQESPPCGSLE